jgi:hypothetical protein
MVPAQDEWLSFWREMNGLSFWRDDWLSSWHEMNRFSSRLEMNRLVSGNGFSRAVSHCEKIGL